MKKLTPRAREYQMRLAHYAMQYRWKKQLDRQNSFDLRVNFQTLKAPSIFALGLDENRKKVLNFLSKVRECIVLNNRNLQIDFSATTKMVSDGTLLFYAELCRAKKLVGNHVKIRCIPPRNPKVAQVLKQVGIFDLVGYRKQINTTYDDVVNWRAANGHKVTGAKYDDVLGHYDGQITEALGKHLYLGLTEAMTNCHHHAYIGTRPDGLKVVNEAKEWWMFSQEKDGRLTVVFCDLGIGIPGTLPIKNPTLWQRISTNWMNNSLDAHAIKEAIEESRTRTGKHHRGKGLKQLVEVVSKETAGRVRILSNRGSFTLESGSEFLYQYKNSILGTLISWQVPLGE